MTGKASKNIRLDTKNARLKLPSKKRHFSPTGEKGISIGYRRGSGFINDTSWLVRYAVGGNKYKMHTLACTDDYQAADGDKVLDYRQALKKAVAYVRRLRGVSNAEYTVKNAADDYLDWYVMNGNNGKGGKDSKGATTTLNAHILPVLGDYKLMDLTREHVKKWLDNLAASPARLRSSSRNAGNVKETHDIRARKATANRILTVLKVVLNVACFQNHKIDSDIGWRTVRPFKNVDAPRVDWFSKNELTRLINACNDDFRPLVRAALFTGCRYGELCNMNVSWLDIENGLIHLPADKTKGMQARDSYLSNEGIAFFSRMILDKSENDYIFYRSDGLPWGKSHQARPMKKACANARITPPKGFHILRHSYATAMINNGVSIEIIAQCLGDKDLRTVRRHYAHLLNDVVKDAVREKLPVFGDIEPDNVTTIN